MKGNAFAQDPRKCFPKPVQGEDEKQDPPAKRPRLSNEARCLIESHAAAEDTALEVDHMILDYLAYQATAACLASRDAVAHKDDNPKKKKEPANTDQSLSLANNLAMADSFVSIFKRRHPGYAWDEELRFRLRLLQFTSLFTQRLTRNPSTPDQPTLEELRKANQTRAMEWIGTAERIPSAKFDQRGLDTALPLPAPEMERNRAQILYSLQAPAELDNEPAFYGTLSSISLLDLLPLFMHVSADQAGLLDRQPTDLWLGLAADFMLQASLEQYLVRGSEGTDAVDNAFAWGDKIHAAVSDEDDEEEEDEDEHSTSHMLVTPADPGLWKRIKHKRLAALLSSSAPEDIVAHLEKIADQNPIATFEADILKFLNAVRKSVPAPVLIQKERGKLDDLSTRETREFFAEMT